MEWTKAQLTQGQDGIVIPGTWLNLHYYEALNILFRIENGLRVFVYLVLKNEQKEKWADITIASDDDQQTTIGAVAIQEGDPSEYWGSFSPYGPDNFISDTSEYPWMPTPVSSDVPF